jgi:LacI family transcriptional regulator
MTITIKKIADDLKLAVSTVSKALRDSHEISEETKKRVLEYASELDYIPNPYASSLKKRKTNNIAVVLPEVADSFFSISINGIEEIAQAKGYHVMIYLTHEDQEKEQSILREFRSGRVDGVLISASCGSSSNNSIYEKCAKEIPMVFFDRVCEATPTAKVLTDDFESGYKATDHLAKNGCKRIFYLGMGGNLSIISDRLEGYKQAIIENGLGLTEDQIQFFHQDEEKNLAQLRKVMGTSHRPDGLVASVEKIATQAYVVCNELNLGIPQDVKVIAFSSLQIAGLLHPPLTTITQPAFEMGRAAATVLFKMLEKKRFDFTKEKILLPSVLIERGSSLNIQ